MAENNFIESGISGLKNSFGTINEEYLKELKGTRAVKVYKEMSTNDPTVSAVILAIDLLIRQVPLSVQPYDSSQEAAEDAIFVDENWNDMSHTPKDFMSEVMSMGIYGWAWFETVFKLRQGWSEDPTKRSKFTDGRVGWRKFALRSQDTLFKWKFNETDKGLEALIQQDPDQTSKFYEIPLEKSLLFRTSTYKNNPEGKSLLRHAYRAWYFKKNLENFEAIGIERDLCGIPSAKVPASIMGSQASATEKALYTQILNMLAQVKQDETAYICLPSDVDAQTGKPLYEFVLLNSGGSKTFDTDKVILRKSREIAMTVLADFLMLGHETVGSFALSSDKSELFYNAIKTWVEQITSVLNSYAIPRLFRANAMNRENYPKFKAGDIKSVNLDVLGRFIQTITAAGAQIFPDPAIENYLKKLANLPIEEVK
jgi:hypothetical protein